MRVNKKMLQQQLCKETGKIVLRDLSNMSLDSKKGQSRKDLHTIIKMLMENASVEVYSDEEF